MTKKAIVLGGTSPHIALIKNLKERGFYVILIDYSDNPPAKFYADKYIQESTLDIEKILEVAKKIKPKLVISTSIDQANLTACYVSEKLKLGKPYSYSTAIQVTDKSLMKKKFFENRIPSARYQSVENFSDINLSRLKFPLIVKPVDSNGSKGVRKVRLKNELEEYFEIAKVISRNNKVIVEEFKKGKEYSADFFIKDGNAELLLIREKFTFSSDEKAIVMQSPGSFSPAVLSNKIVDEIKTIGQRITQAFELENTSLLVQVLIDESEINVIEFAPRIGGGLSFRTIFLNAGFDIVDATINSFIGEYVEIEKSTPKKYIATIILYCHSGIFKKIIGADRLIKNSIVKEFYYYKTKGSFIGSDMSTNSRVGAYLVEGKNIIELMSKIKISLSELKVFDSENRNILKKDIYDNIYNRLNEYVT